ncbi:MAG: YihA family ribosome biogenesis GTP-binding protein [Deltaproteobacteria bacterium]|nr:YihA family ribosome biogenesis GTP-binding protein [Deltaproteobacteria bacterium]MBW1929052.1 YihA family ribosome biogenesis GTP-binding protein [Deltaproteobacteria bacterium]MBW2024585.1 YihA family ribosome biogenesis GTP-binding protein [Deltaproteobacteria bacterium]MBW2125384.1 YihA family ribosome biogenesis GTP-binding protein [Deltaproteobacteria bacterium]RLB16688.1 MAG: YihA family ribosome biogenesis GTP-binding protein [Deltaproteobacteria bacterium]
MQASFITSAFSPNEYPPADRPEIAFAGRSNVGKSSLLNTLANRRRLAVTSSRPGRTQSINFFSIGKDLYFVDLPGYGYAKVPLKIRKSWGKMVETYLRERPNLKGVVLLLDIRREPGSDDLNLLEWLRHYHIPALVVLTKSDKLSRHQTLTKANKIAQSLHDLIQEKPLLFSARTGLGKEELWELIHRLVNTH